MDEYFGVAEEIGITKREIGAVPASAMAVAAGRGGAEFREVRRRRRARAIRDAVGSLPITVGQMNDSVVRLVRLTGRPEARTACHRYEHEDGLVLVTQGRVQLRLADLCVPLRTGELMIIPKDVEHCMAASEEVHLMVIEPKSARPAAGCRLPQKSPRGAGDARGETARDWPPYVRVRGLV